MVPIYKSQNYQYLWQRFSFYLPSLRNSPVYVTHKELLTVLIDSCTGVSCYKLARESTNDDFEGHK